MPRKPKSPVPTAGHNSIDQSNLRELVARIEEAEDERIAASEHVRGLYQEARGSGFDVAALRAVVKLRREDASERQEREELVAEYMSALGMLQGTPLGNYAMHRDGIAPPV